LNISIIGQGYVGLPLAIAVAQKGHKVLAVDNNLKLVNELKSGHTHIEDINENLLLGLVQNGSYSVSGDYSVVNTCEVIIICVPTPITRAGLPDLTSLKSALTSVAKEMSLNTLVVIESTIAPGTTRNIALPLLSEHSGFSESQFDLAFSPERIDPSNKIWNLNNTPKIVAGLTKQSKKRAIKFYSEFVGTIVECESLEIAETAKLLENSFRLVNISFINEMAIFCNKFGIAIEKVIEAAASKPYGFMSFYPSIGIGGHCIPVDPLYLAAKAREINSPVEIIELSERINREMPSYFVGRAEEKIGGLKGKKVLVVGVSYKPNVADVRETPVEALFLGLKNKGAEVFWHDELVEEWNGEKSVALSNQYDLAILATPHDYLDLTKLGDVPILNTRGSS
jgi:UDP-N-acetyl-D-glucosamine dehydrogenase